MDRVQLDSGAKNWTINDFELGKKIGEGQYGTVYLAREKSSRFACALKVLYKKNLERANMCYQLRREIEIQSQLKHKNILQLYGYFMDENRIYLILELAWNGSVYEMLQKAAVFSEEETANIISQLAEALSFCQGKGIIHRDIKPENLLINHEWELKLADFGSCVHDPVGNRQTFCGTRDYVSPEMLLGKGYTKYTDNWALGVLTYELLTGKPAFDDLSQMETYRKIVSGVVEFPTTVSKGARSFILSLLQQNPLDRLPFEKVKSHPWITTGLGKS